VSDSDALNKLLCECGCWRDICWGSDTDIVHRKTREDYERATKQYEDAVQLARRNSRRIPRMRNADCISPA